MASVVFLSKTLDAAVLEPALEKALLQETASEFSVLIQLKETPFRGRESISPGEYRRMKMMQAQTLQKNLRGSFKARVLWISNSVIMTLSKKDIAALSQDPRVVSVYWNRPHRLIQPSGRNARVSRRAFVGNYTYGLAQLQVQDLHGATQPVMGAGQRVGVIDSGVDGDHPEFAKKIYAWKDFVGNKTAPYDDDGHGTHVAGTIAGGNRSRVQIGLAPKAKLAVAKVLDKDGNGTGEDILSAMQWMADPDGDPNTEDAPLVVNNSWGIEDYNSKISPDADPYCRAVNTWDDLGILAVVAAGNEGPKKSTVGIPARCPKALAVGAIDEGGDIPDFSSRGPVKWLGMLLDKPEIFAAGVDVISTRPEGRYGAETGTSMSSPHIAGLAALTREMQPELSAQGLAQTLVQGYGPSRALRRAVGSRR